MLDTAVSDTRKGLLNPRIKGEVYQLLYDGKSVNEISEIIHVSRSCIRSFLSSRGISTKEMRLTDQRRTPSAPEKGKLRGFSNEPELWGCVIKEAITDVIRCCKQGKMDAEGDRSLTFLEGGGNFRLATMLLRQPPKEVSEMIISALHDKFPKTFEEIRKRRGKRGNGKSAKPKTYQALHFKQRRTKRVTRRSVKIDIKYNNIAKKP
jgi:hypothetical protein